MFRPLGRENPVARPKDQREVTELLLAWGAGDEQALERLAALVYRELHRLARGYMARERHDHALQTTALVDEAHVRLVALSGGAIALTFSLWRRASCGRF